MKDPCESCPKEKSCKNMVCNKWITYIKSYCDRNAIQMRITQYTETEE